MTRTSIKIWLAIAVSTVAIYVSVWAWRLNKRMFRVVAREMERRGVA